MDSTRILWRLSAIVHPVVANHLRDSQLVIRKDCLSPFSLNPPMGLYIAPSPYGILVAPIRKGQDFAGIRQALETLDRNEPIYLG